MFKKQFFLLFKFLLLFSLNSLAQEISTAYQLKKITASRDTIQIDSVSINASFFKLLDTEGKAIDTAFYKVDYSKGILTFKKNFKTTDTLTVRYLKFPEYLTKQYTIYDKNRVVNNDAGLGNLYKVSNGGFKKFTPLEGLTTTGSISRGISIGTTKTRQ